MDFDIPIPRATKRPKKVPRQTTKAAPGSTFKPYLKVLGRKTNGPTSRPGISGPGMPDPSFGSTERGVSSGIPRISASSPNLSTPQSSIDHANPAATRTNLVSSPIDSITARNNNTNSSQSMSSPTVIAAAAAVRERSLAQNSHGKKGSTQRRPLCVGDFIKGLRDGEPTQAVRDREASRKRRRGKSGDVEKNDSSQNNGSSGSTSSKAPSTDGFNRHSVDSKSVDPSVAGSTASPGNSGDTEKDSSATSPQNRNIVPTVHMVDGNIVINQASMVFVPEANNTALEESNTAEESHNRVTSASYSRRTPAMRWTVKDTRKFYDVLRQFGPNFAIIEEYFPQRTRRQIKNKFIKEEIQNRKLINWAVTARTGMTLEQFNVYLERKYSKGVKLINV
eukprot:g15642.t1